MVLAKGQKKYSCLSFQVRSAAVTRWLTYTTLKALTTLWTGPSTLPGNAAAGTTTKVAIVPVGGRRNTWDSLSI